MSKLKAYKARHWLAIVAILSLSCFFLLYKLGAQSVRISDEALYVNSAHEMLESGDLLVLTYLGQPDHYNCKPPLAVMAIAASMAIFGTDESALRLPSVLFALFTILMLLWFCQRFLKRPLIGYLAMLVLVSSPGYLHTHIARTADTDAMLIFFVALYCFCFLGYLQTRDKRTANHFLLAAVVGVLCAFFTKGIVAFIPVPGLLLYALYARKLLKTLGSWRVWVGMVAVVLLGGGYLLLRESHDPGYLAALNEVEWGNRFSGTYGGHAQPFYFYVQNLLLDRFFPWVFLFVPVLIVGWIKAPKPYKDILVFCGIMVLEILLVFSIAQTKLQWYDGPVYPFLAVMLAVSLMMTIEYALKAPLLKIGSIAVFGIVLAFSSYRVLDHINHPDFYPVDYEGQLMLDFKKSQPSEQNFTVYKQVDDSRLQRTMVFYQQAWEAEGYHIQVANIGTVERGQIVLAAQPHVIQWLEENYALEVLFQTNYGKAFRIL